MPLNAVKFEPFVFFAFRTHKQIFLYLQTYMICSAYYKYQILLVTIKLQLTQS